MLCSTRTCEASFRGRVEKKKGKEKKKKTKKKRKKSALGEKG